MAFSAPVARRFGSSALGGLLFFMFFLVCGLAGNIGYALVHPSDQHAVVGASGAIAVPTWAPVLVGMVAVEHLAGGSRRRLGLLELPALARATVYAAAVALLVVFGPGSTKAFIYFQF